MTDFGYELPPGCTDADIDALVDAPCPKCGGRVFCAHDITICDSCGYVLLTERERAAAKAQARDPESERWD